MNAKQRISQYLITMAKTYPEGMSTEEIADALQLRRPFVSACLNELVKEGVLAKSTGRPIYYRHVSKEQVKATQAEGGKPIDQRAKEQEANGGDVFAQFIGSQGSLRIKIEQCRSAVTYPGKGLPILLNGCSGVGKSYLAELIYRYALERGVISENAPFITLNCADYANNPELLSATLFGYVKGAFTGADSEKEGLIAQADGGYLFLDEVHRLNSESQEKLFLLMDKDEYRRIGQTKGVRKARVRLIFATTEDPSVVLIHTLRRRIPMVIHIPDLSKRPIKEKLELMALFFHQESKVLHHPIKVSAAAVNSLLSLHTEGNIGTLQNVIRYCCAYVYRTHRQADTLFVDLDAFPLENRLLQGKVRSYVHEDLLLSEQNENRLYAACRTDGAKAMADTFHRYYSHHGFTNVNAMQKELYRIYEEIENKEGEGLLVQLVEMTISNFEKSCGVKLPLNSALIITAILSAWQDLTSDDMSVYQKIAELLKEEQSKLYHVGERLSAALQQMLGTPLNEAITLYIALFLITSKDATAASFNAIIMAHGSSTASSIASVANELLQEYVFESFDLPIDTSDEMFRALLERYLSRINKRVPTLILVDMGSLLQVNEVMSADEYQEIGIIDHVSTPLALEAGTLLLAKVRLADILPKLKERMELHYRYIPPRQRQKAIVCICISGIGMAEKIKEIVKDFVPEDISLFTYDYMAITTQGKRCPIFHEYDVQCLIGTSDLTLKDIPYVNINRLVYEPSSRDILNFSEKVVKLREHEDFALLQQRIIKAFSLENLLSRLVFLNPSIVIDDVEQIILDMEVALAKHFTNDMRMMLFLHIAVLIERTMLRDDGEEIYQSEQWMKAHDSQLQKMRQSFHTVEKKFHITIAQGELVSILAMIEIREQAAE